MRALIFACVASVSVAMGAAAQTPPPSDSGAAVEVEVQGLMDVDTWLREAVMADAQRSFEPECGQTVVPRRAFLPLEFTGGGPVDYAVPFGRVVCVATGGPGPWQGTGGVMVQFWSVGGGPPRLALEHSMHGFTVEGDRLVTYQHGGFCPDGAGPDMCRVTYAWSPENRRLEVVERVAVSHLIDMDVPIAMEHGYEELAQ